MRQCQVFVIQKLKTHVQAFGFYTFPDFLKALPCRQSLFHDTFDWPYGQLVADCATLESVRKVLPEGVHQLTRLPWPETIPNNCELWIQ